MKPAEPDVDDVYYINSFVPTLYKKFLHNKSISIFLYLYKDFRIVERWMTEQFNALSMRIKNVSNGSLADRFIQIQLHIVSVCNINYFKRYF